MDDWKGVRKAACWVDRRAVTTGDQRAAVWVAKTAAWMVALQVAMTVEGLGVRTAGERAEWTGARQAALWVAMWVHQSAEWRADHWAEKKAG
jgi:hypothetical protein